MLQAEYGDDGFSVLAFPSNDFHQEPEDNSTIMSEMKRRYDVNFPMFEKASVNGENAHPLYKWVKENSELKGEDIEWNYQKFLIDGEGNVKKVYSPEVEPLSLKTDIENLLYWRLTSNLNCSINLI